MVVFDPGRIENKATFESPHAYPAGIPHVIVNGVGVVRDNEFTGSMPGKVLRAFGD